MANLQIRIDDELRDEAQEVAQGMGMDLTTVVRVFLRQMVTDRALPFKPELDPFYSPKNQQALKKSISQIKDGRVVTKTLADLEEMAK